MSGSSCCFLVQAKPSTKGKDGKACPSFLSSTEVAAVHAHHTESTIVSPGVTPIPAARWPSRIPPDHLPLAAAPQLTHTTTIPPPYLGEEIDTFPPTTIRQTLSPALTPSCTSTSGQRRAAFSSRYHTASLKRNRSPSRGRKSYRVCRQDLAISEIRQGRGIICSSIA